ncbi:MAG: general secretion pathway protein GspF [Cellvibrionaceae bacterium]|nr:general secretion pathway protein GspF [Cellvibrionaceae bacterium]
MKRNNFFGLNQPLAHRDHRRPMSRREFVSQGFALGTGTALGGSLFGLLGAPKANALSAQLQDFLTNTCGSFDPSSAKIPFICFDLAGGANIAGSNVLIGGTGGQRDFLSTSGYQKQGLPVDQTPNLDSVANPLINDSLGLLFHSDSQLFRGIADPVDGKAAAAAANINGAVIPARSENDTGNNPHNPMYAINRAGANGELLALIGSRASDSGGNSMAPSAYMNPEVRPTKVDRASDATGLVDTGELVNLLGQADTEAVMESIYRLSNAKLGRVDTRLTTDAVIKDLVRCGYVKGASNAEKSPDDVNPALDANIVGPSGIFTQLEYDSDTEFRKTAAIMKLVLDGYAGAGTVTMSGYDYHTGDRATGELRDLRAGRCIGACLDYARRVGKPLMVYVFSDGSVFSNGMIDTSVEGRGKGVWTGDNQQTAASFFLVYNPTGRPQLLGATETERAQHQQIGYMRASGDVETTATVVANNVNLLVDAVALNYLALHGASYQTDFVNLFGSTLGNASMMTSLTAFQPII